MKRTAKKTNCVYVIELDKKVLEVKNFRKENSQYKKGNPCVYVGQTSKTPEERFNEHKNRKKNKKGWDLSSRFPREFGIKLISEYTSAPKSYSVSEAKRQEKILTNTLKKKLWAVYSR